MSLATWIGIVQLTMALTVTWCAARLWLTREPQIAARICLVGLVLGSTLALFMLLAVPRPVSFHAEFFGDAFEIGRTISLASDNARTSPTFDPSTNKEATETPAVQRGIELRHIGSRLLIALRSLSTQSRDFSLLLRILGIGIAVGAVIQIGLVGIGTWQLVRLRRSSSDIACPATFAQLHRLCDRAGVLNPPQMRVHPLTHSALVSWLDPRVIYLPTSYTSWKLDELDAALAHELMHIVRHDGWWRYISRLCTALLWFHPGAWLVHHQLCLAQEVNADRLASQLIPGSDYLVGLAKLGLRLDSDEHCFTPKLSVSVFSKDLIRRIETLKRTYTKNAPANRLMAQGTLAAVALICVTSFCWTVDADETVRIASRAVEPTQSEHVGFQKPKLEPWQVVPAAEGYAAIRVAEMREHAYMAPILAMADQYLANGLAGPGLDAESIQKFTEHGVRVQNIAAVQMNLDMTLSTREIDETDEEASETEISGGESKVESRFSVTSHQFVIDTVAPIDWRSVTQLLQSDRITEMYNQIMGEAADQSQHRSILDRLANVPSDSTRISIHTEPNCGDTIDSTLASVWKAVDGGFVTLAIDYHYAMNNGERNPVVMASTGFFSMSNTSTSGSPAIADDDANGPATQSEQDRLLRVTESEQGKLMQIMGHLGIGIDESSTPNELALRVVCTPVAGTSVDELEAQWGCFATAALAGLESDASMAELAEAVNSLEFTTRMLKMRCQRIGGDGSAMPACIILSGTVPLP